MLGSITSLPRDQWPGPPRLIARVLIISVGMLGLAHLLARSILGSMIPVFQTTILTLDDDFTLDDVRIAWLQQNLTLRFRANLSHPVIIYGHRVYPFGWRGRPPGFYQVAHNLDGELGYEAVLFVLVLAWPTARLPELGLRLLIAIPVAAAFLIVDVSTTTVASLCNGPYRLIGSAHDCHWMLWSRFLMGGGGYAFGLLFGGMTVALANHINTRVRWKAVTRSEFEVFLGTYPKPFEVRPPWEKSARLRYVRDSSIRDKRTGLIAFCRHARRTTRYYLRAHGD